jgi:hypothetical protein
MSLWLFCQGLSVQPRKRIEKDIGTGMAGGVFRGLAENDPAARVDDENARQLAHVADGPSKAVTAAHGGHTFQGHGGRKQAPSGHLLQPERSVELSFRVGHQRERYAVSLLEFGALGRCSHAHQQNAGSGLIESIPLEAQLRHLLAAERSAEVPQENENELAVFPEVLEP